jgi:hypothetical protein
MLRCAAPQHENRFRRSSAKRFFYRLPLAPLLFFQLNRAQGAMPAVRVAGAASADATRAHR